MLFAAAAGYFGILGWNFCLKHIDAVVFSTVGLADPVLTGYIAWFIGLEGLLCHLSLICARDSLLEVLILLELFLSFHFFRCSSNLDHYWRHSCSRRYYPHGRL